LQNIRAGTDVADCARAEKLRWQKGPLHVHQDIRGSPASKAERATISGNDEMDEASGGGWAELQPDGTLESQICEGGDEADFIAKPWHTFFNSLLEIPHQFGFERPADGVLDLAARDPDVAQGAVVEIVERLDGGAALQQAEQCIGAAGD
jgi:hypothetical protein